MCVYATLSKFEQIRFSVDFMRSRTNCFKICQIPETKFGDDPLYTTYIHHIYHVTLSGLNFVHTCEKLGNLSRIFHTQQLGITLLLFAPKY